jgi:hypothetical protein
MKYKNNNNKKDKTITHFVKKEREKMQGFKKRFYFLLSCRKPLKT